MKKLIIIPTHNEANNITQIIDTSLSICDGDILVIDDASSDGTPEVVSGFSDTNRVHLLARPAKLGLGRAYVDGFRWGLTRGYDLFFEMDGDNSHNPAAIPHFLKAIEGGYDLVVGSRYLNGTISVVGWDFKRLLLSKFGNWYATTLLGLRPLTDVTSGYRCLTRRALETIGIERLESNGYAFQVEVLYRSIKSGLGISEIAIIFYERASGRSKLNGRIIMEAMLLPFRLRVDNMLRTSTKISS